MMESEHSIKEEYITFKTARLAKIQGFHVFYYAEYYDEQGRDWIGYSSKSSDYVTKVVKCPQGMLQAWLRKKHNLHVIPYMLSGLGLKDYSFSILKPRPDGVLGCDELLPNELKLNRYPTYEEALERGLYEALKLIDTR